MGRVTVRVRVSMLSVSVFALSGVRVFQLTKNFMSTTVKDLHSFGQVLVKKITRSSSLCFTF